MLKKQCLAAMYSGDATRKVWGNITVFPIATNGLVLKLDSYNTRLKTVLKSIQLLRFSGEKCAEMGVKVKGFQVTTRTRIASA